MEKSFENPVTSDRFYFCLSVNQYRLALKQDVLYLESTEKGYVLLHLEDGETFMISTNLGNVAQQFDPKEFVRISRRYLINRAKVTFIRGNEVSIGMKRLEMSKSGSQRLFALLPILRTTQWKVFPSPESPSQAI